MGSPFTFLATDLLTGEAREELPLSTFSYEPALNRPGGWSATLPLRSRLFRRLDYEAHIRATRPAIYWPLHLALGPAAAVDVAGGLLITVAGGVPTQSSAAGFIADDPESESLDVQGTGYYVTTTGVGAELAAELEQGFTIMAWINGTGIAGSPAADGDYDVVDVAGIKVQLDSSTFKLQVRYATSGADEVLTSPDATAPGDRRVSVRYDGTELTLAVDGEVLATTTPTLPPQVDPAGTVKLMGNLRGRLEHVAVWARALSPAELRYSYKLALGPKTLTTTGKITDGTLEPKTTAVWVDRGGVILFGGILWADGLTDAGEWRIGGMGPFSYFYRRRLRHDRSYEDTDQLDIVRALITYATAKRGGDIGLTVSANTSGRLRDREWFGYERKVIGELVTAMAELIDGFDYGTDYAWVGGLPAWALTLGYPKRGTRGGLVLEHGKNIVVTDRDRDGFAGGNLVDAIGAGEGDRMKIATATDPALIGSSQPLLEDVVTFKSVKDRDTLEGHAQSELAATRQPLTTLKVRARSSTDLEVGGFTEGDEVRLIVDEGPLSIDGWYRIVAYKVAVGPNGMDALELELADSAAFTL